MNVMLCCWIVVGMGPAGIEPSQVSASGDWGRGYDAAQAADGAAGENGNYWQTPKGRDRGAWWQADLGLKATVRGLAIAYARYQDKVHCPPARIVIQTSLTARDGSWTEARTIAPDEIPRDREPYPAEPSRKYPLAAPCAARFVRLCFPDGGQAGAQFPGYVCLGEVEIDSPQVPPQIVTLEGPFGKAEIDTARPALVGLTLRGPGGLEPKSLLARRGARPWARAGYTYVVAADATRFDSRLVRPERVELVEASRCKVLRIAGVRLAGGAAGETVATENWELSAPGDGRQLLWRIERRWERDFAAVLSGCPALFSGFQVRRCDNSVTSTIWYDPLRLAAGPSDLYRMVLMPGRISENHLQTVRDRDTWAIYKLWTGWPAAVDLRLEVDGGHLYRRGSYAVLSEAGAVTSPAAGQACRRGQVERIALRIAPADKLATGYQLAVTLPDKKTEAALKEFYAAVLNGGAVNDQKGFDFGNETDGWYYAGSSWMYGAALAAGVPAAGRLSAHPYDAARAMREHLVHILSVLDDQGRAHFGYNQGGQWVDDNLHTILGTRSYLLHTGDLAFVRQHLPALERMLAYFARRRNAQGLFRLDDVGAHWYYDAVTTSGVNAYYNAFFYKAAVDLAEMEQAAGRTDRGGEYRDLATGLKAAFNRVFWKEDAPGGPRYIDWIDAKGRAVCYFCDLCQWPAVAVGIASPEQARKIVATADARIAQLEKEHGYQGLAGLSALWPVPQEANPAPSRFPFGTYMNGGSLLVQTYWEIVARARAADAKGAARRLAGFARRAAEIRWSGDNAADIHGEMRGGDGEPYLADMVAATAGVIHGILGIRPTWDRLEVTPCLPPDWPHAAAEVLYKGRRQRIVVEGGRVEVHPMEQAIEMPLVWQMDANLRSTPTGTATLSAAELVGPYGAEVALAKGAASGSYQSPAWDWAVPARADELVVTADLHGGRITVIVETSGDGFRTIHSQQRIAARDGVDTCRLATSAPARWVRVRFELARGRQPDASPTVDGFRLTASPAANCPPPGPGKPRG